MPSRAAAGLTLALLLCLPLPAFTTGAPPAANGLAPSEFVVTRPGLVLVDVAARRAELEALPQSEREALCGAPRQNWPRHGVQRNVTGGAQPAQTLALTMMLASAGYLATGDPAARDAIVANLLRFAEADALSRMSLPVTVNHFYNLDRTLLPIIGAFAMVHDDPALAPGDVATIRTWLDRLVRKRGPGRATNPELVSSRNNHRYLRDSVTMAWGAFSGDNALFFEGVNRYRLALEQMREDGSLPLETDRGRDALFYQRHAIASLVAMAEIAAVQGYDLYALTSEAGLGLHDMVAFLVEGIDDPAVLAPYTTAPQDLGFLDWRGHDRHYMAWFEAYRARFPESPLTARLAAEIAGRGSLDGQLVDEYAGGMTSCLYADPATRVAASGG
ncbi:MAG: alginate lyase family protein [Geminicoccaceae bacterium]